jgi:hypothetical protein
MSNNRNENSTNSQTYRRGRCKRSNEQVQRCLANLADIFAWFGAAFVIQRRQLRFAFARWTKREARFFLAHFAERVSKFDQSAKRSAATPQHRGKLKYEIAIETLRRN